MPTPAEIGVVTGLSGEAFARSASGVRTLEPGSPIYQGEELVTGDNGNIEIRFVDDTLLSQGGNSHISLDDYVFDPDGSDSDFMVNIAQGTFRMVTGQIAEQNPERFKVGSPLATIGIRGTTTIHEVIPGNGEKHGVEEIHSGKALLVQSNVTGTIRQIAQSMGLVEVSSSGTLSSVRPLSMEEFNSFREIAGQNIRQEQEIREQREQDHKNDDDQIDDIDDDEQQQSDDQDELPQDIDPGGGDAGEEGEDQGGVLHANKGTLEQEEKALADQKRFNPTDVGNKPETNNKSEAEDTGEKQEIDGKKEASDDLEQDDGNGKNDTEKKDLTTDNTEEEEDDGQDSGSGEDPGGGEDPDGKVIVGSGDIEGTPNSDIIFGSDSADTIHALASSDIVSAEGGDDTLYGEEGSDTLIGGTGDDILHGGTENDTLYGEEGNDTLYGDEGSDTLIGGTGDDAINGGTENDTLYGDDGDDTLKGDDGNDKLYGDRGEDILNGGKGDNYLDGGSGAACEVDFASFIDSSSGVEVTLNGETPVTVNTEDGTTTLVNIEGIIGSNYADTLTGDSGENVFYTSLNQNFVDGDASTYESVDGGSGDEADWIKFENSEYSADINLHDGYAELKDDSTAVNNIQLSNIENVEGTDQSDRITGSETANTLIGNAGDDSLIGMAGDDSIQGGDGDDFINAGTGTNAIDGGDETDTLSFEDSASSVTLTMDQTVTGKGSATNASPTSEKLTDSFENIEILKGSTHADTFTGGDNSDTFYGNDGDDVLIGGAGGDTLYGDAGEDILYGGKGDNYLDGGSGLTGERDFASYVNAGSGVNVNLNGGTATGLYVNDILTNIEGVIGSNYADTLIGDSEENVFYTSLNQNFVDGDTSTYESVDGGSGEEADWIKFENSEYSADINLHDGYAELKEGSTAVNHIQLSNIENVEGTDQSDRITGSDAANTLIGNAGDDSLIGMAGDDSIQGGDGDDFINAGTGNNAVDGGSGVDTLSFEDSASSVTLAMDQTVTGKGSATNTSPTPDKFIDTFEDIEIFKGSTHADTFYGGDNSDTFYGNDGDDVLIGGAGDDKLYGEEGNDELYGGKNNDILYGDSGNDILKGDEGNDTLIGGTGDDAIYGGTENDTLYGNDGDDTLIGGDGDDKLYGDAGEDIIYGGKGDNYLDGGSGAAGEIDFASYVNAGSGVNVNLSGSTGTATGLNVNDILTNIEGVIGSNYADTLIGDSEENIFYTSLNQNFVDGDASTYESVDGGSGDEADWIKFENSEYSADINLHDGYAELKEGSTAVNHIQLSNIENVEGTDQSDRITGSEAANTLIGNAGDDSLIGMAGNDSIQGGDGDDFINAGTGTNAIDGGNETDTLSFEDSTSSVTLAMDSTIAGKGSATNASQTPDKFIDTFEDIEIFEGSTHADTFYGGDNSDTFHGNDGDDVLIGGAGNDKLYGESGADILNGGKGDNYLDGGSGAAGEVNLASFIDSSSGVEITLDGETPVTVSTDDGTTTLVNIEGIIGSNYADTLIGDSEENIFYTSLNQNFVEGDSSTYEYVDGGSGDEADWIKFENSEYSADINLHDGYAALKEGSTAVNHIQLSNIENVEGTDQSDRITGSETANTLIGNAGDDSLIGMAGDDSIQGGDGDDFINAGTGNNAVDGGSGVDTLSFEDSASSVTLAMDQTVIGKGSATNASPTPDKFIDTFEDIEIFKGSTHADTFTGGDNSDTFYGNDGDDALIGGAGDDKLYGEEGNDELHGGKNNDILYGDSGNDILKGDEGNDTLIGGTGDDAIYGGTENDTLYGNDGDDTLIGGDGDDKLYGGSGADILNGGKGDNYLDGGSGAAGEIDFASYVNAGSGVNVNLSGSTGTATGLNVNDILTNIEGIIGSNYADTLIGDSGENVFYTSLNQNFVDGDASTYESVDGGSGGKADWIKFENSEYSADINLHDGYAELKDDSTAVNHIQLSNIENVEGTDQSDRITGSDAANTLIGNAGDDSLIGMAGNDSIQGGDGDDFINAGTGTNAIDGGDETDTLSFEDSASSVTLAMDSTIAGKGSATNASQTPDKFIDTFEDIEIFEGSTHADTFYGGDNSDTFHGNDGDDVLIGGAGDDKLYGEDGNDELYGEDGNDTLYGGDGGDILNGGKGDNYLDGGTNYFGEFDLASFADSSSGVEVTLNRYNPVTVNTDDGVNTLVNIEGIIGSNYADTLIGDSGENVFYTSLNQNFVEGDESTYEYVDGGSGDETDWIKFDNLTQNAHVNLNDGYAELKEGSTAVNHIQLTNIENVEGSGQDDLITGSEGNNTLLGNAGDDSLLGMAGNDSIHGGDGNDFINSGTGFNEVDGGEGFDTLSFEDSIGGVNITRYTDEQSRGSSYDYTVLFKNIERIEGSNYGDTINGSLYNDTLDGNGGDDTLIGDEGNDTLYGGAGEDTLYGGKGDNYLDGGSGLAGEIDFVSYLNAGSGVNVNLSGSTATGADGNDTITNIEGVIGSNYADTLIGDSGENVFYTSQNQNFVEGDASTYEYVDGGSGDEADWIKFDNLTQNTHADLTEGYAELKEGSTLVNHIQLANIENVEGTNQSDNITGSDAANTLIGNAGNDSLIGMAGDDSIQGGEGDDFINSGSGTNIIDGGNQTDTLSFEDAASSVTLTMDSTIAGKGSATNASTNTEKLTDSFENVEIFKGSTHADTFIGGENSDTFYGNDGDDTLIGRDGNDTLYGEEGNDKLYGGDNNDTLYGGDGNDTLKGDEGNDTLYGGAGADILYGGKGDNYLDGGSGAEGEVDFASFADSSSGVEVTFDSYNPVTVNTDDGTTTLVNIEGIIGSNSEADWIKFNNLTQNTHVDLTEGYAELKEGSTLVNHIQLANIENVEGTNQSDNITGSDAANTLIGNHGNDSLIGMGGNDSIQGGDGDDFINSGKGTNTIDGGNDADTLAFKDSASSVTLTMDSAIAGKGSATNASTNTDKLTDTFENIEIFEGSTHADTFIGGENNDTFYGNDGDDALIGGAGDDKLYGEDGDDFINSGSGANTIDGGEGTDTLSFEDSSSKVVLTLDAAGTGSAYNHSPSPDKISDTFENIEIFKGSNYGDEIYGSSDNDTFYGNAGDDTIKGYAGNDDIKGGDGNDILEGNEGNDKLYGEDGNDELNSGDGNDTLYGGAGEDILYSGKGDNYLDGGTGLTGEIDFASYVNAGSGVNVNLSGSIGTAIGTDGNDSLVNIEGVIGSNYADTLIGDAGENVFYSSTNQNFVEGIDSTYESVDGGSGSEADWIKFENLTQSTNVNLNGGYAELKEDSAIVNRIQLANIENVEGTAKADQITGSDEANTLLGNAGDDVLIGMGGNDSIKGGDGDDFINAGAGNNVVDGGEGTDSLSFEDSLSKIVLTLNAAGIGSAYNYSLSPNKILDSFENVEILKGSNYGDEISGSSDNDTFYGNAGDDTINGGAGYDKLYGGFGDDKLHGGENDDILYGELGNDELSGGENNDTLYGGDGNDTLKGDDGNDSLYGDAGEDILYGGKGDNYLDGGDGADLASFADSSSGLNLTLSGATPTTVNTDDGTTTLVNIEGIIGSDYADTLTGDSEENVFYTSLNQNFVEGDTDTYEYVDGGSGDETDWIKFENLSQSANINLNTGDAELTENATVVNRIEIANIENVEGTDQDDIITGSDAANTLIGNDGDDSLIGMAGNDSIQGGDGDDFIAGNEGTNSINGGSGIDTLSFEDSTSKVTLILDDAGEGYAYNEASSPDTILDRFENIEIFKGSDYGDIISGSLYSDTFEGNGGNDTITGFAGNDHIKGGDGNDKLYGQYGDDTLYGEAGNDTLYGGTGDNYLDGGSGAAGEVDFASFFDSSSGINVTLAGETPVTVNTDDGATTLVDIEGIIGSNYADTLIGDSEENVFYTSLNQNFVEGDGSTYEHVDGGSGSETDWIKFDNIIQNVHVNLNNGSEGNADILDGSTLVNRIEIANIENVAGTSQSDTIAGSGGDNTLLGNAGEDSLIGMAGNDSIQGGDGDDFINSGTGTNEVDGGEGTDTLTFKDSASSVTLTMNSTIAGKGSATNASSNSAKSTDTFENIEIFKGSNYADTFTGGDNNDTFYGNAGADVLSGEGGNDIIYGEEGDDDLYGGDGDDTLYGEAGTDILYGGKGNNYLDGGYDSLGEIDLASFEDSSSGVNLTLSSNTPITVNTADGITTLVDIEGIIGSNFADTLIGDIGENVFYTSRNQNFIDDDDSTYEYVDGGEGNAIDWIKFDNLTQSAQVNLTTGDAELTENSTVVNRIEIANIENVEGTDQDDKITGSDVANTLLGNAGNDTLIGMGGNDSIQGGDGDDFINAGSGANVIIGGDGTDTLNFQDSADGVFLSLDAAGKGLAYNDSAFPENMLANFEQIEIFEGSTYGDTLKGSSANDTFIGNEGDDTITGYEGNDYLKGGDGTDTLKGDEGSDKLWGEDGNDFLYGAIGEDSLYGGAGNDNIYGGSDRDYIQGGAGADKIRGEDGNDKLWANDGDDTVWGGAGDDTAYTGAGTNILYGFDGVDTNTPDAGIDTISFAGLTDVVINNGAHSAEYAEGSSSFFNFEIVKGSENNDLFVGSEDNDTFYGENGNDTFISFGGSDSFDGGNGLDSLMLGSPDLGAVITAEVYGQNGEVRYDGVLNTSFLNVENFFGTMHDDEFTGNSTDETFHGNLGDDVINGGDGLNTISFADEEGDLTITVTSPGTGTAVRDSDTDNFENIQSFIGGVNNDSFIGSEANETFEGSAGYDTINGGGGTDFISFAHLEDYGVTINLSDNTTTQQQATYGTEYDYFENIEGVIGSNNIDNITASSTGASTIQGGGGDDQIHLVDHQIQELLYTSLSEGGDTIYDFETVKDYFQFSGTDFEAEAKDRFTIINDFNGQTDLCSKEAYFVYDDTNNMLYYDADGNASDQATLIAEFSDDITLSANNIHV